MSRTARWHDRGAALRALTQEWVEEGFDPAYGLWLVRHFGGRAFRVQLKVLDRRAQARPARVQAARIHQSYRRNWR